MTAKKEILQIAQLASQSIFLQIAYQEGDLSTAVGQLYSERSEWSQSRGTPPTVLANTNIELSCFWLSPSKALWVGGTAGHVGTTAKVSWPTSAEKVVFKDPKTGEGLDWTFTNLPPLPSGLPPNVAVLWGTSDRDVHAAIYGGHLYRWNGKAWSQVHEGPGRMSESAVRGFAGSGPKDVFAAGNARTLLHFDGARWKPLPPPAADEQRLDFIALHRLPGGELLLLATGDEDSILFKRVLFAAANAGVAELLGGEIKVIRDTFKPSGVFAGTDRWFFTEPSPAKPSYCEYWPGAGEKCWKRFKYD